MRNNSNNIYYFPAAFRWMISLLLTLQLSACILPPERIRAVEPPPREPAHLIQPYPVLKSGDLLTLNLKMDPTDGRVLFEKEPFDKSSFPVVLEISGQDHSGRAQVLGSSSRRLEKKSILIKLDKGQEWQGQRRFALDAMGNDISMMRERLAWDTIHSLGMVAPDVHYRRIEVNGQFIGLFLQTEWIKPAMFERFGLGGDGQFLMPNSSNYCGNFDNGDIDRVRHCWIKLSPRDDDYQPISQLSQQIADMPIENFDQWLDQHFEADSVINWILVNTLTANGDTYNKNFFLYQSSKDDRWTIVPFDYDLAFGRNFDPFLPFPQTIFNDNFIYYYPPELGAMSPLKEKVLRSPTLRARLMDRMRHLLGIGKGDLDVSSFGLWHPDVVIPRIEELSEVILPYALSDYYRDISRKQFEQDSNAVIYFMRARWHYLVNKLFGDFPWDPKDAFWGPGEYPPPPPLPQQLYLINSTWQAEDGEHLAMIASGYGFVLAFLDNIRADEAEQLDFFIETEMAQAPKFRPPNINADQCIQRSWYIALKTPAKDVQADLTLEYLQENSERNELGSSSEEQDLSLWVYQNDQWNKLNTITNSLANTLQVKDFNFSGGELMRLVACSPSSNTDKPE